MLFPLFLTVAVWIPAVYELGVSFVSLAAACGTVVFLAHVARALGREAERALFVSWSGPPTTRWLSHGDDNLDPLTKSRYHACLTRHIDGWVAPSPTDERRDKSKADLVYGSAIRWLREQTRDRKRYPLVFEENVSYGFRRNLYGLKPIGLCLAFLCTGANYFALKTSLSNTTTIGSGVSSLVLSLAAAVCWIAVVRRTWVRDSAEGYARALLGTCDEIRNGDDC